MSDIINSVLQDWVMTLNWKEQTGLISSIRGTDGINLDEEVDERCKCITKMIRFLILNNADSKTKFMTDDVIDTDSMVSKLRMIYEEITVSNISAHWFDHIFLAIKIIMKKHPNAYIRMYWLTVYLDYKTTPVSNVEQVILEETTIPDDNITEIKDILTVIDNTNMLVESSNESTLEETPIVHTVKDEIFFKPTPITSTTDDKDNSGDYNDTIFMIDLHRIVKNNTVTYDYLGSYPSEYINIFNTLHKLDAIITNNWDLKHDTMSAEYDIRIPISKSIKVKLKDAIIDSFMVEVNTRDLLYKINDDTYYCISSSSNYDMKNINLIISEHNITASMDIEVYLIEFDKRKD